MGAWRQPRLQTYIADAPGDGALLARGRCLVGLTFYACGALLSAAAATAAHVAVDSTHSDP
jgi:hypothetical protein